MYGNFTHDENMCGLDRGVFTAFTVFYYMKGECEKCENKIKKQKRTNTKILYYMRRGEERREK
jgi:hypothetical protein